MEHAHRIVADAPTPVDRDVLAAAAACPDNESVPYSKTCIDFMQGDSVATDLHWRVRATSARRQRCRTRRARRALPTTKTCLIVRLVLSSCPAGFGGRIHHKKPVWACGFVA